MPIGCRSMKMLYAGPTPDQQTVNLWVVKYDNRTNVLIPQERVFGIGNIRFDPRQVVRRGRPRVDPNNLKGGDIREHMVEASRRDSH